MLVVSCLAFAAYLMAGYQPSLNFWTPVIALYSVAAHRSPRTAAAAAALTAAVILYSGLTVPELGILLPVVQALAVPVVVWLVGNGTRRLAERNRQLAAVTEQLRREQEERARQAVTEERMRIARELHDVVAHHMAVIAQHADLANYVFSTEPLTARQALETIGASGREGLAEMRSMLDLLRVGPEGADDDSYTCGARPGPARRTGPGDHLRRHAGPAADRRSRAATADRDGAERLPDRPGGADQRGQACPPLPSHRTGAVRRRLTLDPGL